MAAEAGRIEGTTGSNLRIPVIHGMILLSYGIRVCGEYLVVRTKGGISNTMISLDDDFELRDLGMDIFASVENEFGVVAGFEIASAIGHVRVAVPIMINRVLSSPSRFTTLNVSLNAGYEF